MIAHVKRVELLRLSKQAALAVPKNCTVKELAGIHLEADAQLSMLTLTATNLEISIRAYMGATVEESGGVIINAKLLSSIMAKLPEDDVDLELLDSGQLSIRSGATGYSLDVLSGSKYPTLEMPFPDDTIPVTGLWSLVRQTAFAASQDEKAPIMSCIKLILGPDGLKGVSTNGYCIMEARGDKNCKGQSELLVPAHSMAVLAALSKDSDVYEMGLAGKSIVFSNGTLFFSARLMEGKYPNTAPFLEKFQGKYSVNLAVDELANAVSSAAVVDANNPKIELSFGEHEVRVCAQTEHSRAAMPVKALVLSAPDHPFYYNPMVLLKYLKLLSGNVTLDFDANGLMAVRSGTMQYIQSPLRPPAQTAQVQKAA